MFRSALPSVVALLFLSSAAGGDTTPTRQVLEAKLHGSWRGGPCRGLLTFYPNGRFERRHYSPGDNELSGVWTLHWDALPPSLQLVCQASDDPTTYPVGKTWNLKITRLDEEHFEYDYSEELHERYVRATERELAVDRVQDVVVTGTITQAIGVFGSHGGPLVGDTFEFDLGAPPKEAIRFQRSGRTTDAAIIPLPSPLIVERMREGKSVTGPARTAIFLSTSPREGRVRIQVTADSLQPGGKVRIGIARDDGFLGSRAEAEGVVR